MQDAIRLASIKYTGIIDRLYRRGKATPWRDIPSERICAVLEDHVIPATAMLLQIPSFQDLASYSVVALSETSDKPARQLLKRVQSLILEATEIVKSFLEEHWEFLENQLAETSRKWSKVKYHADLRVDASELLSDLNEIAEDSQSWWVSANDFFGPRHNTFIKVGETYDQCGEYMVQFNPELAYVGNYVARCMLIRAGGAVTALSRVTDYLHVAIVNSEFRCSEPWPPILDSIRRTLQELRIECLTSPQASLAEAANILVQLQAEFSRVPLDLGWLGIDEYPRQSIKGRLRHTLAHLRDVESILAIKSALDSIVEWWHGRPERETELELAIAGGGLVIDFANKNAFWRGALIQADWDSNPLQWKLLVAVANTRGMRDIGPEDVYDSPRSDSAFANLKSTLAAQLPADLRDKIKASGSRKHYRLDLPYSSVRVFC